MLFRFAGTVPYQLHEKAARCLIDVERSDGRLHGALKRVHAGSRHDQVRDAFPLKDPLHSGGIRLTPVVTEACKNAPRGINADHVDQVLAHLREGMQVVQNQLPPV